MIKISEVVVEIVHSSEIASTALRKGYLNLSAYAKSIKDQVEDKCKKPVKLGSIVVALSRLPVSLKGQPPLLPNVVIEDLTIKSPLVEITFDKTRENLHRLRELYRDIRLRSTDFLTVTHGVGEITIVAAEDAQQKILEIYESQKPKAIINNLVGLTVRYGDRYIEEPNVIYTLLKGIAVKRINIVEIISTYTELTFILDRSNLQEVFLTLNEIFQKSKI